MSHLQILGAQFKQYLLDPEAWANRAICRNDLLRLDSSATCTVLDLDGIAEALADDAVIEILRGEVVDMAGDVWELTEHFTTWQQRQGKVTLTIECDYADAEFIKMAIHSAGGRIITTAQEPAHVDA